MKYEEELARKLINPDGYLWFEDSSSFSYLEGIAIDAYAKKTTEGFFTAAIIYHQLTEHILTLLIRYSDLIIQANVFPVKMDLHLRYDDSFGKLLIRHKNTVDFKNKSKILKRADEINNNRIKLVHEIHKLVNEDNINPLATSIRDNFNNLFSEWKEAMYWCYNEIKKLKKQTKWEKIVEKYS